MRKEFRVSGFGFRVARAIVFLFLSSLVLRPSSIFGQDIKATAKLDTNVILVGQQAQIELSIEYKADKGNFKIQWPTLTDTVVSKVEIVGKSKIDTSLLNKEEPYILKQTQTITITAFDSGYYALPPFKFIVNGDTAHPVETEAMLFQVNTIAIDTTQAIKDIKPPMEVPFSWKELLPYLYWGAGAIAIIAIAVYVFITYVKKKPVQQTIVAQPKIPPHVTALEELEKLKQEKLWQEGNYKMYHSRLADIVRWYIEARFKIQALEQTSDEILHNFRYAVVDEESKLRLRKILLLADLVKFAKEVPLENENNEAMENAVAFINGTSREEKIDKGDQLRNAN